MKLLSTASGAVHMIGGGGMGVSHPTDAHIYVVVDASGAAAMIDAGSGVQPQWMLANLEGDGLRAESIGTIALTHTHWDHARGCAWWQRRTGAQIAHRLGRATVEEGAWADSHLAKHGIASEPARVARSLEDGDAIAVGALTLKVVHTPGHSSDSVSFLLELDGRRLLFGGDTVFAEGGHGTVSADTDFRAYRDSVRRLAALRIDALLPSHKQFVLSRAHEHVALLERKLSGRWTDVVATRVPFFPTWWLEHDATLYDDARTCDAEPRARNA